MSLNNVVVDVPELICDKSISRVRSNGEIVYKEYMRGVYLGKGAHARCWKVTSKDSGIEYAAKVITRRSILKPLAQKRLYDEICIHRSLQHPNIVKFHRFFQTNDHVYLLLDLCSQHNAQMLVDKSPFSENDTKRLLSQLLDALEYLHSRNIIHRDIKLSNLFFALDDDKQLRLGDFGLSIQLKGPDQRRHSLVGTPSYIAPEVLSDNDAGHSFGVDIWSFGICLYTLLVGKTPFDGDTVQKTYENIRNLSFYIPDNLSVNARDLIPRLLVSDPEQRLTLQGIRDHPFFVGEELHQNDDTTFPFEHLPECVQYEDAECEAWEVYLFDRLQHEIPIIRAIRVQRDTNEGMYRLRVLAEDTSESYCWLHAHQVAAILPVEIASRMRVQVDLDFDPISGGSIPIDEWRFS